MASKYARILGLLDLLVMLLLMSASADFAKDRQECADQLVGLATCLPYVQGEGKAPTLDCCTGLKQVLQKSKKCLCVLIKDRDDPNLGFKINTTLALSLPTACNTPANMSECPGKHAYVYEHVWMYFQVCHIIWSVFGICLAWIQLFCNSHQAHLMLRYSRSPGTAQLQPKAPQLQVVKDLNQFSVDFFSFVLN